MWAFAGGAERRGETPAFPQQRVLRRVRDEVEDRVDAVWMSFAQGRLELGLAVEDLADAELAEVVLVFAQSGCDHVRICACGELDEEAADAASGADHEHGLVSGRC